MVEPNTEADPAAILVQFLVAFGALVGRGPHFRVEGDEHHANLNLLLVGATAKGRKGTALGRVRAVYERIPHWKPHVSGLSSGEGLKYNVRDAREETKENKHGEMVTEITDEGVTDKRLLVVESEFASALRAAQRQGSTLSPTMREAWDSGNLRTLTKHDPVTATGAHICIIGHITADELRAELTATDTANGFANRFLFVAVRRSKMLPVRWRGVRRRRTTSPCRPAARAVGTGADKGPDHDDAGRPGDLGCGLPRALGGQRRLARQRHGPGRGAVHPARPGLCPAGRGRPYRRPAPAGGARGLDVLPTRRRSTSSGPASATGPPTKYCAGCNRPATAV